MNNRIKRWTACLLAVFLTASIRLPRAAAAETGIPWPGPQTVSSYDTEPVFYSNASGLDFQNGRLYAADNGGGFLWVFEAFPDGTLRPAKGYETAKAVQYADRESLLGPDTEGITVSDEGLVYLAAERDNDTPWKTTNTILQLDPWEDSDPIKAQREWDLTQLLPEADANKGIEAVEWVAFDQLQGKLTDSNTGRPFDRNRYPKATANGLFFVALEMNDRIYAFVLSQDSSAVKIAELDPQLQGISALEYDPAECALWVMSDDRGENVAVKLLFSEEGMALVRLQPPGGVNQWQNTEGFAIAEESFTRQDSRPVYRLEDGVSTDALTVGAIHWHIHSFSRDWLTNENQHWHSCACGETTAAEEHALAYLPVEGAIKTAAGPFHTATYYPSCRICGYVDTTRFFVTEPTPFPKTITTPTAQQIFGIPTI